MARHYLNLHHAGRVAEAWRWSDQGDLDAVHGEALAGIRSVLRDELTSLSRLDLSGRVEVTDERGDTVLVVPFVEAMELDPGRNRGFA